MQILSHLACLMVGALFGVFFMCLFKAAKEYDESNS